MDNFSTAKIDASDVRGFRVLFLPVIKCLPSFDSSSEKDVIGRLGIQSDKRVIGCLGMQSDSSTIQFLGKACENLNILFYF